MDFFEHLDKAGGFYYERWGDAPVHSIGAALFAKKDQIHFFEDIGYRHEPFQVRGDPALPPRRRHWRDWIGLELIRGYSIARRVRLISRTDAGAISTTTLTGNGTSFPPFDHSTAAAAQFWNRSYTRSKPRADSERYSCTKRYTELFK
jgi:hypothetical protein